MKSLLLKRSTLRYLGAVVLITLAGLLANPTAFFLVVPVGVVSIKFFVYDVIVGVIATKFSSFKARPWLLVGYALAVAADMLFTYGSATDGTDTAFAFLGTLVITPWILVAALTVMIIATLWAGKNKQ